MNPPQSYIAVEGVIGVGKTTLARLLQREFNAQLVLEVFEENPFLSDFYTDRARYAFQTQIFFLLSRYHQQRQLATIPRPLISDYMFDKDRLFAQVNLDGDELVTYYRVQEALAENSRLPDQVIFLKADTDTLMRRITARDRPYERNMESGYIDSLRTAYDQFFAAYDAAPVLVIDTTEIDFVRNPDDYDSILSRIRGAVGEGPRQPALPGLDQGAMAASVAAASDGEARGVGPAAQHLSVAQITSIRAELADVLAHLFRLATHAGVDLEAAFQEQIRRERVLNVEGESS
ncbi:MAG: hypothetical protein EHM39_01820 [Chloroflexi bacterium]|nr:MAG: hypothetical protein EHM39_01820 [Chloroflexota bacterium]